MAGWQTEFQNLSERILGAPFGSAPYWISLGIAVATLLIVGWIVASLIFQAKRGFILTLIAQVLPAIAAGAAHVATERYVVGEIGAGPIHDYLPLAAAILGAFLCTLTLTRWLLGIGEMASFFSVLITYACVIASVFMGSELVTQVDEGFDDIEGKKNNRDDELLHIVDP